MINKFIDDFINQFVLWAMIVAFIPQLCRADDEATIKGKVVIAGDDRVKVDFGEFKADLVERISLKQMPVPEDWATRTNKERQKWIEEFNSSEAGKEFQKQREETVKKQKKFELEFEKDGSFIVYDVPPASYELFGRLEKNVVGKKYAVEIFAQVDVGEVNEVVLAPLPISITRLLAVGETAPEISIKDLDGKNKFLLSKLKGKYILVSFWSIDNSAAKHAMRSLQKAYEQLHEKIDLNIVSICVDQSTQEANKFVAEIKASWFQGYAGSWSHQSLIDYGIRAIPSFWLVGRDGKVLMTEREFLDSFSQGKDDFQEILAVRITELGGKKPDLTDKK